MKPRFLIAVILAAVLPAFFLPRRREVSHFTDDEAVEGAPPVVMH